MNSAIKTSKVDGLTARPSYVGPAVLFAEDDASIITTADVISPPVNAVVVSRKDGAFELRSPGTRNLVDALSFDICAAIAVSHAGDALLAAFRDHIRSDFPEITRISRDKDISLQIATSVQTGLMRLFGSLATRNSSLVCALAAVRREHEVLQNAFASLEELVLTGNLPEKPAFTSAPTDRILSPLDNWPKGEAILQRLPISSRAVSTIDLCFFVADESSQGHFDVTLRALEDGAELGDWRVPFERISVGWMRFQLGQALMGQPRTLQLEIRATIIAGEAPNLVLAALSPLDNSVYQTTSGLRGESPLAFRVWRSLPGVRTKLAIGAVSTGTQSGHSARRYLPAGQLAAGQLVIAGRTNATDLLQYFEDLGELQVHPIPNGLVAAHLKAAIPPFTSRLSASVLTRSARADIVDYALLALPSRDAAESALSKLADANAAADGFSGWSAVPPMEPAQISLSFERPPRAAMDLLLITRAHRSLPGSVWRNFWKGARLERGNTRYAWARFFDVEVELAQQ